MPPSSKLTSSSTTTAPSPRTGSSMPATNNSNSNDSPNDDKAPVEQQQPHQLRRATSSRRSHILVDSDDLDSSGFSSSMSGFGGGGGGGGGSSSASPSKKRRSDKDDDDDDDFYDDDFTEAGGDRRDEMEPVRKLAKQENRHVKVWRRNVFLAMFAAATLLTSLTYMFLDIEDTEDFETSFDQLASTIQTSLQSNWQGLLDGTHGLSQILTSEAHQLGMEWPFVTLTSFEVYVQNTRTQTHTELMVVCPVIHAGHVEEWNEYSILHQDWIDESFQIVGENRTDLNPIPSSIYRFDRYKGRTVLRPETGLDVSSESNSNNNNSSDPMVLAPFWQMSPPPFDTSVVNLNALSFPDYHSLFHNVQKTRVHATGQAQENHLIHYAISQQDHDHLHGDNTVVGKDVPQPGFADDHPHSVLAYPVFERYEDTSSDVVAMVLSVIPWDSYLQDLLPTRVPTVYCVLRNSCGQVFTYTVRGPVATFLGPGDLHETGYEDYERIIYIDQKNKKEHLETNNNGDEGGDCRYWFSVYPSSELSYEHDSSIPIVFAILVASTFFLTGMTFLVYDRFVVRKNNKILDVAIKSNAIVASMFPSHFRDRLFEEANEGNNNKSNNRRRGPMAQMGIAGKSRLRSFLDDKTEDHTGDDFDDELVTSKPIADLFPECTIMFADLVGFTAWSSSREPVAVFILLETIYRAFDKLAKRRRVFKVETVGDSYVAVAGVPDPRKDHALAMARFAHDCMYKLMQLTKKLEESLGPDTGDLTMRFGLNSGPVTAGILRGERSRFQLFGDTMNTASRMESTGVPNKIQISQATADLLIASGKANWITPREDRIVAKGKGELKTYWLNVSTSGSGGSGGHAGEESYAMISEAEDDESSSAEDVVDHLSHDGTMIDLADIPVVDEKTKRLIRWNVDTLMNLIKQIGIRRSQEIAPETMDDAKSLLHDSSAQLTVLEEVKEIIPLPDLNAYKSSVNPETAEIDPAVKQELQHYVSTIASMYKANPFHNFEHASHVTLSAVKLLSRIVTPDLEDLDTVDSSIDDELDQHRNIRMHDYTYGITSDPLTQFACAFSALIHDVDHPGIPNAQLMLDQPELAAFYKGKSIAEQKSVDLAWELLGDEQFSNLRRAIYRTEDEKKRFRQLVVNSVMATDILDRDLKQLRNNRWDKAFSEAAVSTANPDASPFERDRKQDVDRKATIVIEHLIQASDVAHTMQHWQVFLKWNTRLFEERYKAFLNGDCQVESDPSENWYQSEIGFFDYYIIPLAKKLKDCGVFGVSSDEYLNYALVNRQKWEDRGPEGVDLMIDAVRAQMGLPPKKRKRSRRSLMSTDD